jgi:hypothetical protein
MIGTHTIIGKNSKVDITQLSFLKLEPWFKVDQIDAFDNISMFISHYYGYPYTIFNDEMWTIMVEGMIYNLSDKEIKSKCELIANNFINNDNYIDKIKEFTCFCDGAFIIQIYDKKAGKYLVFNDYLGRLPLYYSNEENNIIISRSIKTQLEFASKIELDLTGIVEFLMLGFTFGEKTLFKNISRLEPFQAIIIEDFNRINNFQIINTCEISYNRKKNGLTKKYLLEKLSNQFIHDTKNRLNRLRENGYEINSDLSGGFDSRALIGALSKFDKDIKYFTYEYIQDESVEAQKIFNELGAPGKYIKLKFDNVLDVDSITELVYKTDGLVDYLTTSICYNDASSIKYHLDQDNKFAHFGGYGGEFIRVPTKIFFNSVYYGFRNRFYSSITMDNAISLFNSNLFIKDEISDYFDKNYRYNKEGQLRKFFYEYSKLPLAGEERERLFYWTVHPMWSKNWIRTIYEEVPLRWTGFKFYINFMKKIQEKLLSVPIYKRDDLNMTSQRSINNYEKKNKRQLSIKTRIKHIIKYYLPFISVILDRLTNNSSYTKEDENVYNQFLKYYNKLEKVKPFFNLERISQNINYFGNNYNRLITLVMYFVEIEKRYSDKIVEIKN